MKCGSLDLFFSCAESWSECWGSKCNHAEPLAVNHSFPSWRGLWYQAFLGLHCWGFSPAKLLLISKSNSGTSKTHPCMVLRVHSTELLQHFPISAPTSKSLYPSHPATQGPTSASSLQDLPRVTIFSVPTLVVPQADLSAVPPKDLHVVPALLL